VEISPRDWPGMTRRTRWPAKKIIPLINILLQCSALQLPFSSVLDYWFADADYL
jgi:hypothetical protein